MWLLIAYAVLEIIRALSLTGAWQLVCEIFMQKIRIAMRIILAIFILIFLRKKPNSPLVQINLHSHHLHLHLHL